MGGKQSKKHCFPVDFQHSFDGKVIIIGAGVAGMTAGYVLNELGIEYKILEASSTYGGRIKKVDDFADFPIDLGAEWVHHFVGGGRDIPFLKDILSANDADYKTFAYKPATFAFWNTKKDKIRSPNMIEKFVYWLVNAVIGDHKFKNSTWFDVFDKRVYPIVKDHIIYNQVVEEIDYQGAKVLVRTKGTQGNSTQFEADKVLSTVPIQILQKKMIRFVPAMPAKKTLAIENEMVPEGVKVFMEFSEKFYEDVLIFDHFKFNTHTSAIYDAAYNKDSKKHILGFFLMDTDAEVLLARVFETKNETAETRKLESHGGRRYKAFTDEHREKLVQLLLEDLDKVYDGKASKTFKKSVIQNWSCEPYIQGSYSSMKLKGYKDRISPLSDKVYFAGEAFNLKRNMIAVHATAESSYLSLEAMLKQYQVK